VNGPRLSRKRLLDTIAVVSAVHNVSPADVLGRGRFKYISRARQHAMWMLHQQGYAYVEIGRAFGHVDHTATRYGVLAHADRQAEAA
jgi:chromosomal replication initiation ATPase DnaA